MSQGKDCDDDDYDSSEENHDYDDDSDDKRRLGKGQNVLVVTMTTMTMTILFKQSHVMSHNKSTVRRFSRNAIQDNFFNDDDHGDDYDT